MILCACAKCSLNCVFCDRKDISRRFPDPRRIMSPGKAAAAEILLVGGEPMLHPSLPGLIDSLRGSGAVRIALQSNGLRASYPQYARALTSAGLTCAGVLLPMHEASGSDRLARTPGAFDLAVRGIRNLLACGIGVSVRVPILRPTLPLLPEIVSGIVRLVPGIGGIELFQINSKDPGLEVPYGEFGEHLSLGRVGSAAGGTPVRLDTIGGIPFCILHRIPDLLPVADSLPCRRVFGSLCGGCDLRGRCPGIPDGYLSSFGDAEFTATGTSPRVESSSGPLEKVSTSYKAGAGGGEKLSSVSLRITRRCNRRCSFCFIPYERKVLDESGAKSALSSAVAGGASEVVLTGGEPTLHKDLAALIQAASRAGVPFVGIQTNGIRLADGRLCRDLVHAGLTFAQVSIPSHRAEALEDITGVRGTLKKILRCMENLSDLDVPLSVTHVACTRNYRDLPDFTRFIVERFRINVFTFLLAAPFAAPMARPDIIVRYSDAAPFLKEALDYCLEAGVRFEGLWERCGIPICFLEGKRNYYHGARPIPEANRSDDFMDGPGCGTCIHRSICYGVRRLYALLYGTDELVPVHKSEEKDRISESLLVDRMELEAKSDLLERTDAARLRGTGRGNTDEMRRNTFRKLGGLLGLGEKEIAGLDSLAREIHVRVAARSKDGRTRKNDGWRVQYAAQSGPTTGALEISPYLTLEQCRGAAVFRGLRAAALDIPLGGAHGGLSLDPARLVKDEAEAAVRRFARQIGPFLLKGRDFLTAHTSTGWPVLQWCADELEARGKPPRGGGVLRPEFAGPQEHAVMPAVHSAVEAAALAARQLGMTGRRPVSYALWGFGSAARGIAGLMRSAVASSVLVGCADSKGACVGEGGLDEDSIIACKLESGRLPGRDGMKPGEVLRIPSDILFLVGRGEAFAESDAAAVGASIVVDMTACISHEAQKIFMRSGRLFVPAVLATCGNMAAAFLQIQSPGEGIRLQDLKKEISSRLEVALKGTASLAREHGLSMTEAVYALGIQKLACGS